MNGGADTTSLHPVARALHSHPVGYGGALVAVVGALYPVIDLFTNRAFVVGVLHHDRGAMLELAVVSIATVAGALCALVGKGPLAPKVDDTVVP